MEHIVDHVKSLKCLICGREYRADEVEYVCPEHGDDGILDVQYDYDLICTRISPESLAEDRNYTIWRYRPLMPIEPDSPVPPLTVGWTPLYRADRLAAGLGLKHVWVKDDGRNPSASFKDRASAVAVVKAREKGAEIITTSSTGNAGAALSALCASVGQPNVVFVPESAPPAKVAQLLVYGSTVMLVRGSYDDAFALCAQAAKEFGWYNRNTGYNPYMSEGKKTGLARDLRATGLGRAGLDRRLGRRRLRDRRRVQGVVRPVQHGLDQEDAEDPGRAGGGLCGAVRRMGARHRRDGDEAHRGANGCR